MGSTANCPHVLENATLEPNSYGSQEHKVICTFSIIIFSVTFLLGTSGNGLVIWCTTLKMKKTVIVVWLLNLAVNDFLFTLFLPFTIATTALNRHWTFGRYMCKLNATLFNLNLFVSVLQLTIIGIERCISVIFPMWFKNHRTPRLASFVVVAVWILAFLFSSPYFIFRDTLSIDNKTIHCDYKFDGDNSRSAITVSRGSALFITRFILGFLIPFTIIVLCYVVTALHIQKKLIVKATKPLKIIIAVIVSFFVCWFPYQVFVLLSLSNMYTNDKHIKRVVNIGYSLTKSLTYINSCINPILYAFVGRTFKKDFWRSIQQVFENAFMEEATKADFRSETKSSNAF
ncbi:PREDICTED: N-formyl peptide receptor 2-like [Nanorana parkeri]|uniref:N-formyl peptide receptor 2-like n=1 Tax=Nanorana parkeri TaxID=125878 RepID=UPI0008542285|nr:PREDICTED: N-formyl peptide receptor 2-like [Nanorana parkeri]